MYLPVYNIKFEFLKTRHTCLLWYANSHIIMAVLFNHFWRSYFTFSSFWKFSYIFNGITRYYFQKVKNVGKEETFVFVSKITFNS